MEVYASATAGTKCKRSTENAIKALRAGQVKKHSTKCFNRAKQAVETTMSPSHLSFLHELTNEIHQPQRQRCMW